jgi:hypothetical protein
MDAFVQANPRRHGVSWLSINWDDWDFVYDQEQIVAYGKKQAQFAMTPAEGIEALRRILTYGRPMQLLVATRALSPRITHWLHQNNPTEWRSAHAPEGLATPQPAIEGTRNGHDLEHHLAAIYRDVLGLPEVATDDNFFDLGGDSLLASQILLQLRRQLPQVQLQLPVIFDHPTVRGMAQFIAENQAKS